MSDAITRKEAYLKSIGDGTSSALKPITREEQYLAYIAGESKSFPTTPITREEAFLDKIAKSGVSGGSSINVQPLTVTENGTYDAPEGQAYDPVTVDVKPITEPITITENGVYPVPKGAGTIEEGGTYTFKSYISDEEINEWLSKTGQTEQATIFGSTLGVDGLDYDSATVNSSALSGAEFGNHIDVVINRKIISYLTPAYIAFLRENEVDVPDDVENWANVSSDLSIVTKADPPTVTIPSPSLSTENFALSSIFFDIETKSLDGWGDITVNVAGGGSLEAPTISIADGMLTVTDTNESTKSFDIYVDGVFAVNIAKGEDLDLFTIEMTEGDHTITAKSLVQSGESEGVTYTAWVNWLAELKGTWVMPDYAEVPETRTIFIKVNLPAKLSYWDFDHAKEVRFLKTDNQQYVNFITDVNSGIAPYNSIVDGGLVKEGLDVWAFGDDYNEYGEVSQEDLEFLVLWLRAIGATKDTTTDTQALNIITEGE